MNKFVNVAQKGTLEKTQFLQEINVGAEMNKMLILQGISILMN